MKNFSLKISFVLFKGYRIKKIKKQINLKTENWINNNATNCYAFALGLDIPYYELWPTPYENNFIYNGGYIYYYFTKNAKHPRVLSNKENIELDFSTIKIFYEEIDLKDRLYSTKEWKIAFFEEPSEDKDFHFFRQTSSGIWYHKQGKHDAPTCYDDEGKIIQDPKTAHISYLENYVYQKSYRLSLRKLR